MLVWSLLFWDGLNELPNEPLAPFAHFALPPCRGFSATLQATLQDLTEEWQRIEVPFLHCPNPTEAGPNSTGDIGKTMVSYNFSCRLKTVNVIGIKEKLLLSMLSRWMKTIRSQIEASALDSSKPLALWNPQACNKNLCNGSCVV